MLNKRQELFCKYYAQTLNATLSAEMSGYKKNYACTQGSRLLKNEEVKKRITEEIETQHKDLALPDKAEIKKYWAEVLRDPNKKDSVRMSASTNLAKSLFMFNYDASGWDNN